MTDKELIEFLKEQIELKDSLIYFLKQVIKDLWREKNNEISD